MARKHKFREKKPQVIILNIKINSNTVGTYRVPRVVYKMIIEIKIS